MQHISNHLSVSGNQRQFYYYLTLLSLLSLTFYLTVQQCDALQLNNAADATTGGDSSVAFIETANRDPKGQDDNPLEKRVTVIAPKYLRPHSDYRVLVSLANSSTPVSVDIQLIGARDSNREQSDAKSVLMQADETQTIKFEIADWPPAEYILSIQAQAIDRSWNFTKETEINYKAKTYSGFIQTDKAIYKPGQLVQFRALFLTQTLQPLVIKETDQNGINVTVLDPQQNLVKQWIGLSNWRGMLSLELQLSDDPMLGDWTISVAARGQQFSKQFAVAEYILPTFDVRIDLPPYATYKDSDIVATVRAHYTYGKPVNGHVTLTVQPLVRFNNIATRPLQQAQYRARLDNGKADLNVDIVRDLARSRKDFFERNVEFFALVEEDLTGRKYNKTEVIKVYETDVKIELIGPPDSVRVFKPGLDHTIQLKVAYQDDIPVEDNGPELELVVDVFGNKHLETARLRPVGGIVQHTIRVPKKIAVSSDREHLWTPDQLNLEANYRGHKHFLKPLVAFTSDSEQYMKITLPQVITRQRLSMAGGNSRRRASSGESILDGVFVSVGDELRVRVKSTERMQQVTCNGYARGQIIWALSKDAKNSSEFEFDVQVEQRMAPESKILCYYVRPDNKELIADSVTVLIGGTMRNIVKVTTSGQQVKPGERIDVDVLTKPNSLVGIMAVDQSVSLLRSGNDITQSDVVQDLKQYGSHTSRQDQSGPQTTQVFDPFKQDLAANAMELFDKSDMVILSNALVYNGPPRRTGKLVNAGGVSGSILAPREGPNSIKLDRLPLDSEIKPQAIKLGKQRLDSSEPLVIRTQFPENWLWANASVGSDGRAQFGPVRVPDTITSWELSAFSMNENHGLGLMATPARLRVFRPFFIKLNLPYSIIRGETVGLQVVVFNYSKRPQQVKVTLENRDNDFEFVEAANRIEDEKRSDDKSETKTIRVPANDGASATFLISPKRIGHIEIRAIAQGETAADGVVRKLLVKPEGQTQHFNQAFLIDLSGQSSGDSGETTSDVRRFKRNVTIEVPSNAVPGSSKVTVSASGDLMGAGLSHVDDLLRLPYGSGEQNMMSLVSNIVMLNYLINTGKIRDNQRDRARHNIEVGYQRQLNYKRPDGSFSSFGQQDSNGSVWLTAYVLRTLQQAKEIVPTTIDEQVIRGAANYIAHHSSPDGSIEEVGSATGGGDSSSSSGDNKSATVYLTAHSVIALMQRPIEQSAEESPQINQVIDKGLTFLEQQIDSTSSNHDLAIIAYALTLANNRQQAADKAYEKLWSRAQQERELTWWPANDGTVTEGGVPDSSNARLQSGEREFEFALDSPHTSPKPASTRPPPLKPFPLNSKQSSHLFAPDGPTVETTSLALLSTVKRGELDRAVPIARWLVGQQNSNGGFASTRDTALAIEALAAFAQAAKSSPSSSKSTPAIDIDIVYPRQAPQSRTVANIRRTESEQILITPANALLNQQLRLPASSPTASADNITWLQVEATGRGVAVVQVAWQYNILVSAEKPAFYLNPILDKTSTANYLQLSICSYYKGDNGAASNMAVVEAELPSGYVADMEALPGLRRTPSIKRVDAVDGETKVVVYLDRVTRDELCFTVPAHRSTRVSNNKPVPVTIYDYYDRKQAARIFYAPPPTSSCDICTKSADDSSLDECSRECANKPDGRSSRLISLHEQRHLAPKLFAANSGDSNNDDRNSQDSHANLESIGRGRSGVDNTGNNNNNATARIEKATSLLPLAPVWMKIKSGARYLHNVTTTPVQL